MLSRFESGERESYLYHENPGDKYKQVYYEATDRVIACIRERFEQKDYQVYAKMQEIPPFTNKNVQKMTTVVSILSMVTIFVKHDGKTSFVSCQQWPRIMPITFQT